MTGTTYDTAIRAINVCHETADGAACLALRDCIADAVYRWASLPPYEWRTSTDGPAWVCGAIEYIASCGRFMGERV